MNQNNTEYNAQLGRKDDFYHLLTIEVYTSK